MRSIDIVAVGSTDHNGGDFSGKVLFTTEVAWIGYDRDGKYSNLIRLPSSACPGRFFYYLLEVEVR